jgi:phage anti-repressor protein
LIVKATRDIAWDWDFTKRSANWIGNGKDHLKFPQTEMIVETDFLNN